MNEQGIISDVEATTVPGLCPTCGIEAVRVRSTGPDWVPAIQFGKPVGYKGVQNITFKVSGGNSVNLFL